MSSSIVKQIAELNTLSIPQLEERWRKLFGTAPPAHQRRFLVKRPGLSRPGTHPWRPVGRRQATRAAPTGARETSARAAQMTARAFIPVSSTTSIVPVPPVLSTISVAAPGPAAASPVSTCAALSHRSVLPSKPLASSEAPLIRLVVSEVELWQVVFLPYCPETPPDGSRRESCPAQGAAHGGGLDGGAWACSGSGRQLRSTTGRCARSRPEIRAYCAASQGKSFARLPRTG